MLCILSVNHRTNPPLFCRYILNILLVRESARVTRYTKYLVFDNRAVWIEKFGVVISLLCTVQRNGGGGNVFSLVVSILESFCSVPLFFNILCSVVALGFAIEGKKHLTKDNTRVRMMKPSKNLFFDIFIAPSKAKNHE